MSKVWMITGANRGLGLEIAKAALAAGEQVVAAARDPQKVTAALGEDARLLAVKLDVTDEAQATVAVNAAKDHFGRIDVLVNNAGYGHFGPFEEATAAEIEQQLRVNLLGSMHVTRAVLPIMRAQQSGRIFNMSSVAGIQGFSMGSLYCASKYAMEGWSESLALEVQSLGIQVTAVEPGFFRTDFLEPTSVSYIDPKHADYKAGMDEVRGWLEGKNAQQEGDPAKLAAILVDVAGKPQQPVHLLMGADAVQRMADRIQRDTQNLEEWRAVSSSTAFAE